MSELSRLRGSKRYGTCIDERTKGRITRSSSRRAGALERVSGAVQLYLFSFSLEPCSGMMNKDASAFGLAPIHVKIYGVQGGQGGQAHSVRKKVPRRSAANTLEYLPVDTAFWRRKASPRRIFPGWQRQRSFLHPHGRKTTCGLAGQDKAGARRYP